MASAPAALGKDDTILLDADVLSGAAASAGVPARPKKTIWIRVSEALLIITYVGGLAMSGATLYWLTTHGAGTDEFAWAISAIFVGLAVPLSLHDIHLHMAHYVSPLQRHFVRLIAMVPVYALASWFALVYHGAAIYLEVLRDLYEAFALWSFYQLMLEFLGGRAKLAARLREKGVERAKCLPPVCCFRGWKMGSRFVHRNSVGLYQYVIIRTIVSFFILFAEGAHVYREGSWSPKYFYLYAALIINGSQIYALYCLAYLYSVVHDWLTPLRPLWKFLLVKGIVAVTWWQGIFINIGKANGLVPRDLFHHTPEEEVGKALGNFAFCVEMFIAAIMYHYVYSYKDFYAGSSVAPIALLQRSEAEFDARRKAAEVAAGGRTGAGRAGGLRTSSMSASEATPKPLQDDEDDGSTPDMFKPIQLELAPLPMSRAVMDILPTDMIAETGENIRTGFGLTHKWQKRAKARRAELHTWADAQLGSTVGAPEGGAGGEQGAAAPSIGTAGDSGAGQGRPASATPALAPPPGLASGGVIPVSMRSKTKSRLAMSP